MKRYLRPPKRDRLPNTPDPFEMPKDERDGEEEEKECLVSHCFHVKDMTMKGPLIFYHVCCRCGKRWSHQYKEPVKARGCKEVLGLI